MTEWKRHTFAQLIDDGLLLLSDGYRAKLEELGGDGPMFLRAGHVSDSHIDFTDVERFHAELEPRVRRKISQPGDVVITTKGNSTGRVSFVTGSLPSFVYSPHLSFWRSLQPKKLVPSFLRYWSRGEEFQQQLRALACATDMAPYLSLVDQRRLHLTLPPPDEQRAIASVLGALDDKIELNRRMNETLEALAQSLFRSWFVESVQLGLPKGWREGSLSELMDIQGGTQPPASEFINEPDHGYVRLVQIRDYESDAHVTFIPDTAKLRKCGREDVMIARYGASVARICWGLEGAYNVALVKAAPKNPCYREYLRSYLQTHDFQARLIGMSNRSVQAGFNKSDIASFEIPIPPDARFKEYQSAAWALRSRILHNKDESCTLATLRNALLPKLLSGELRAPAAAELADPKV